MANVFSRSWQITKLSFGVMKKDKEMLMFPLLSGIFSIIFMLALVVPSIILPFMNNSTFELGIMQYVIMFIIYLGLAFIATFFNVCTVYTVKTRLSGGDATLKDSLKFGVSKIYVIFLWSLLSAVVGVLLRLLDKIAEKFGPVGEIIMSIVISLLGMAWSILTVFVVPSLVYKGLTPFAAIKDSTNSLKKTWGESLIRYYGLGVIEFLVLILGVIVFMVLTFVSFTINAYLGVFLILLTIIYAVLVILTFNVANTVFNTILYEYAQNGSVPEMVNQEILQNTFTTKPNRIR